MGHKCSARESPRSAHLTPLREKCADGKRGDVALAGARSREPTAAPALKQAGTEQRSRRDACADHVASAGVGFTLLQNPLPIRLHDQGRGALARSALGGRERVGPVVVLVAANKARLLSPGHRARCPIGYGVAIGQVAQGSRIASLATIRIVAEDFRPPAQRSPAHWA